MNEKEFIHKDDAASGLRSEGPIASDPADAWRPIATAPRDGSLFLAYRPRPFHRWAVVFRHNPSSRTDDILTVLGRWQISDATHWMPLPDPPEAP